MNLAQRLFACLFCVAACTQAHASRSSVTDPSDVSEAGDCELEAGLERRTSRGEPRQRDTSLRLACGIGWRTELEAAFARQRSVDLRGESFVAEAKTTLRERGDGRTGWALAVGVGAERVAGGRWQQSERFVLLEATRQLGPRWLVELQFGAARDLAARRNATLWALAAEHALSETVELRAELEGDDRGRPQAGVGLRYVLWPELAVLKLSYGTRGGPSRERRTGLGLKFEF